MTKQAGDYFIAAIVGITIGSLLLFVADRATAGSNSPVTETTVPVIEVIVGEPYVEDISTIKEECVEIYSYDFDAEEMILEDCI